MPQQYGSVDPRSQTEDLGDDPVKATDYALKNMRKVVPQLVAWTTRTGDDYTDLEEIYGETLGMWSTYMGHVTNVIGGVNVDVKSGDQGANVYRIVPKAKQKAASVLECQCLHDADVARAGRHRIAHRAVEPGDAPGRRADVAAERRPGSGGWRHRSRWTRRTPIRSPSSSPISRPTSGARLAPARRRTRIGGRCSACTSSGWRRS